MLPEFRALTLGAPMPGLVRQYVCDVRVLTPVTDKTKGPDKETPDVKGIWDTGATGTVITQRIVDELGLSLIDRTIVHTADGPMQSPVFLVDLRLPTQVVMQGLNVTLGRLPPGIDVLIGMDVICQGDLAITNVNGLSRMTFRVPSCETIDYAKDALEISNRKQRRMLAASQPSPIRPVPRKNSRRRGGKPR